MAAVLMAGCVPTGRYPPGEAPQPSGPAAPRLVQPVSPTKEESIPIDGYAEKSVRIELMVNGILVSETVALADGRFAFPSVRLNPGMNVITAVAIDDQRRRSATPAAGGGERPGSESVLKPEIRVVRQ